jgi:hypothetical protein
MRASDIFYGIREPNTYILTNSGAIFKKVQTCIVEVNMGNQSKENKATKSYPKRPQTSCCDFIPRVGAVK